MLILIGNAGPKIQNISQNASKIIKIIIVNPFYSPFFFTAFTANCIYVPFSSISGVTRRNTTSLHETKEDKRENRGPNYDDKDSKKVPSKGLENNKEEEKVLLHHDDKILSLLLKNERKKQLSL